MDWVFLTIVYNIVFLMIKRLTQRILLLFLWVLSACSPIFAQSDTLHNIVRQFNQYSLQHFQEKVFVHTDRTLYLTGENLWFKIYYVDGFSHNPADISKIAYLEIIGKDNKTVYQTKISLQNGNGNGSLFLPASINSGNYLLRAYTNWMKNFSPEFYFEKNITIINTFRTLGLQPAQDSALYDIQFFPEGGNLVGGIQSKVAFRVVDRHGKGMAFQGVVLDQKKDTAATFQPQQFGIGHFSFTPSGQTSYQAVIQFPSGQTLTHPLPAAYEEGYTMQLEEAGNNQIRITVNSRITTNASPYVYLLAHTRQETKAAEMAALQQNQATFLIDKHLLGEGISHITIFNYAKQAVCERLYFKTPAKKLLIEAKSDQSHYASRKKVSLEFLTHNPDGKPEEADMSVSVYQMDSLQPEEQNSIYSYLWLTSDLKGTIESPDFYFKNTGAATTEALDNLMLTHGWRRFSWEAIFKKDTKLLPFIPEYGGHIINGWITDIRTSNPAKNITVYLSAPGKNVQLYVARSDKNGQVLFETKHLYGFNDIVVQTDSQRDSTYHIEILSPYSDQFSTFRLPLIGITEQLSNEIVSRNLHMQLQNVYFRDKINQYSFPETPYTAFYGVPDNAYLLDDYTRFTVMEDVLREYVPGVQVRKRKGKYHFTVLDLPHKLNFQGDPLVMLDGVPVFDPDKIMAFDPLKIKKLEVLTRKYYYGPVSFDGIMSYSTYKGDLGGFELDPRALVIDYEGLQTQRDFFSPIYDTPQQQSSRLPDFRNLLYWSPDVKTDNKGKKHLEFYTSDQEGKYIVIAQGITKDGYAGNTTYSFEVKNPIK